MTYENLKQKLAETDRDLQQALALVRAQQVKLAEMRAAGVKSASAEGLLEAYRWCAEMTAREKADLEHRLGQN